MKRILIVVESIDVDDSSGSKANVALIKNLQLAGYDLRIYHYTLKDIRLPGIDCRAIKENRRSLLFFLSRTERYLRDYLKLKLHEPLQNKFGFSFTLFNDRNSIVNALQKDRDFKPDLILTLSKGGSFRPHQALLKMTELHSKWVAYMHDPYPMHHYPKPFTWYEPGYKKKEKFVRKLSEKAAFAAFPSMLLKEWMGQFYPKFLEKGVVIPHQITQSDEKDSRFPDYFDPDKFNILHAGNLLGARDPKVLLDSFIEFLKRNPGAGEEAQLIFLGGNNERVEKAAGKNRNVYASREYVSFQKVFSMQQQTAVNVILEAKAEISPFLPGKFPHCINAEKPILLLGPPKSEARRLLGEDYPYWSEIDDEENITRLIEVLYCAWKTAPEELNLKRPDLQRYLSEVHLKEVLDGIKQKLK